MGEARTKKIEAAQVLAPPDKPAAPRRKRARKNEPERTPTDFELAAAALDETDSQPSPGICISIPGSAEYVRVVRLALLGVASRMPFSYDDVEDIKLAVAEACNNAIVHSSSDSAEIKVLLTPYADRLEIDVTDAGRVPPPGLVAPRQKPATHDEELRESGLGLFLMQTLMDKVEHHASLNADTKVHLVKYLPGSPHRKNAV